MRGSRSVFPGTIALSTIALTIAGTEISIAIHSRAPRMARNMSRRYRLRVRRRSPIPSLLSSALRGEEGGAAGIRSR